MRTATLFNFLVEATLIGSVLILALLALRPLLRRGVGSRLLMVAWALVALRLLLPLALPNPAMNALKPTLSQDAGIRPMADQVRTRVEDAARSLYWKGGGTSSGTLLRRVAGAAGNGRLSRAALIVYGTGFLLTALWMLLRSAWYVRRMKHCAADALSPGEQEDYARLCAARGLKAFPARRARGLSGSCAVGLWRPVILLPQDAPKEQIPMMLLRETCHLTAHSGLGAVVRGVCCVVHWFNPLVWLGAHVARNDAELACDRRALRAMTEEERRAYARPMLSAREVRRCHPAPWVPSSCVTLRAGVQKARIRQALHGKPVRRMVAAVFGAVCVLTAAGMFMTDVQSSAANVPVLQQASICPASPLTEEAEAVAFARAFLSLEGVNAQPEETPAYMARTNAGWETEWYPVGSHQPCLLRFTDEGEVLRYENMSQPVEGLHPLARPITGATLEGQVWCAFLSRLLEIHLPACWARFEAIDIVDSGRMDGEQFIRAELKDMEGGTVYRAVLQVAPVGRLLRLERAAAAE